MYIFSTNKIKMRYFTTVIAHQITKQHSLWLIVLVAPPQSIELETKLKHFKN